MSRHDEGPYRSSSPDSYLVQTLAAVALLALAGGVVLDVVTRSFWARNSLLAGLLSSLIVVVLSVAVVNELIERRKRRRWSVLAQYVMLELVRQARLVWTSVMEIAGLMPADATDAASIDAAAHAAQDSPRLKDAIAEALADGTRRRRLHDGITAFVADGDEVLGRWAGVMLNADAYAEIIDRHVELATDVAWLGSLLDSRDPARRRRRRASDRQDRDDHTARRGARPHHPRDRHAHRSQEWWAARLGTTVPATRFGDDAKSVRTPSAGGR